MTEDAPAEDTAALKDITQDRQANPLILRPPPRVALRSRDHKEDRRRVQLRSHSNLVSVPVSAFVARIWRLCGDGPFAKVKGLHLRRGLTGLVWESLGRFVGICIWHELHFRGCW